LLKSVAKINNEISVAKIAIEYPLLVVSNEIFVTAKLVTDKSVAKKLTTINLYPIFAVLILLLNYFNNNFFFFDLRGVSGPAYAHHDYSPRPTGHPASPGAGKAPRG
jgi:hypothetical protein